MPVKQKLSNEEYNEYVEQVTPTYSVWKNCFNAFWVGGLICVIGELIFAFFTTKLGFGKDDAASFESMCLVLLSVILTGLNAYGHIAKLGGAGALVPITGFANSVAAPAIEYQKEGQVFGIGVKIFTIAGPVILYGIFTSWILGILYYFGGMFGLW
ncbi:MAG: stage V sporulation protein AC [Lachnospiraceae bacterium]|nr:stage V sporulation protein AC [Lachnospiraceae bacterium]